MTLRRQPVQALLFDFDGVLINSLPVMQLAFSAALQEVYPNRRMRHGALFDAYRQYLGMGFPEIMRRLELSQEMHAPFRRHSRILAPYVRLYDDAVELLAWGCASGLPMGIATGKDHERTQELLTQLGIRDYFCMVLASDTVTAPKPAPEMALRFAAHCEVAPKHVVLIGDAAADIQCGRAAGCLTAAAVWGYTAREELCAMTPDFIFDTPMDARDQLGRMITKGAKAG